MERKFLSEYVSAWHKAVREHQDEQYRELHSVDRSVKVEPCPCAVCWFRMEGCGTSGCVRHMGQLKFTLVTLSAQCCPIRMRTVFNSASACVNSFAESSEMKREYELQSLG